MHARSTERPVLRFCVNNIVSISRFAAVNYSFKVQQDSLHRISYSHRKTCCPGQHHNMLHARRCQDDMMQMIYTNKTWPMSRSSRILILVTLVLCYRYSSIRDAQSIKNGIMVESPKPLATLGMRHHGDADEMPSCRFEVIPQFLLVALMYVVQKHFPSTLTVPADTLSLGLLHTDKAKRVNPGWCTKSVRSTNEPG